MYPIQIVIDIFQTSVDSKMEDTRRRDVGSKEDE